MTGRRTGSPTRAYAALRAAARWLLGLSLSIGALILLHWAARDALPPLLQHPAMAVQLIRREPPARLRVPVAGVPPTRLRDTWNAPRSGGREHQGIDIFAPRGREVVSATEGIVVSLGANELGGRVVRVLGPGGQWHYYAHLDRYGPVQAGQIVRAGAVLGYVGTTGNARGTPPHLHYGIYSFAGGPLNPYPRLIGGR